MSANSSINSDNSSSPGESITTSASPVSMRDVENIPNMAKIVENNPLFLYDADCVRKKSNWSKGTNAHKFDHPEFDAKKLLEDIPSHSSKLHALLKKIDDLDKKDMARDGRKYKHFIFSDVKSGTYGAKLVAGALMASGMNLGYVAPLKKGVAASVAAATESVEQVESVTPSAENVATAASMTPFPENPTNTVASMTPFPENPANTVASMTPFPENPVNTAVEEEPATLGGASKTKIYGKIQLLDDEVLLKSSGNNFFLLASIGVYDQPITVGLKKSILKKFNSRPDNIHGELARIIVMDSGYKEGIDLFDVKYVHIYEPPVNMADQKQVIGRGTRTCGQKGLEFHPTQGWPLHVFIYDVEVPESVRNQMLGSASLFDLYLKAMNIDVRLYNFQHDLERATVFGSVDYELNKAVHSFSVQPAAEDLMGGSGPKVEKKRRIVVRDDLPVLSLPAQIGEIVFTPRNPETKPMGHEAMRAHVRKHFGDYKWADVKMENKCGGNSSMKTGGAEIIKYSATQDFVRHYFTPENPIKGMLLFHSVGTGKTCSAIAAASSSFEQQGYTILWVTRTTLKNDIWKNMFDQVCSETIKKEIEQGLTVPDEQAKRMRLLSKSWSIRPMSYKQFSNMVSKANNFYKALVKKNGEADPLRKTLLIIDEAHKLYGGGDLSSIERPDMNALQNALQHSYAMSGSDSVKLLLMTATPITESPMELIKLINLAKPVRYQMPDGFEEFAAAYLDEHGRFTEKGEREYLDSIAGHVSYLNREKDARQFAQPIVRFVQSPLIENIDEAMKFDRKYVREFMDSDIAKIKKQIDENNAKIDDDLKDLDATRFGFLAEKCEGYEGKALKACNKVVKANIKEIVKDAKDAVKNVKDAIKALKDEITSKRGFKKEFVGKVKENMADMPAEYAKFQQSLFYAVKNKCGKKINDLSELRNSLKDHPAVVKFDQQIQEFDQKIDELKQNLQVALNAYKGRMTQLKSLMKTNLNELESSVIRMTIKQERKTAKKRASLLEKEHAEGVAEINKTRKALQKKKEKKIQQIRKTMKDHLKEESKVAKQVQKEEKALRKTQRKQGVFIKEFESELLKDLVEKYSKLIDDELEGLKEEMVQQEQEKAAQKQAKQEAKQQKAAEKAEMKLAKQEETKRHRETQKIQKALAKENEKAAKKQEKLAQKEHARTQKLAERQQKLAEKAKNRTKKNQP